VARRCSSVLWVETGGKEVSWNYALGLQIYERWNVDRNGRKENRRES
jgi:hypothetical protein